MHNQYNRRKKMHNQFIAAELEKYIICFIISFKLCPQEKKLIVSFDFYIRSLVKTNVMDYVQTWNSSELGSQVTSGMFLTFLFFIINILNLRSSMKK